VTDRPARFADNEILEVTRIASAWISAGIWSRLTRQSDHDADRILLWLEDETHYRIERDATGWTYLVLCCTDDWKLIGSGSFYECLKLLQPSCRQ
jgi:hypothetical protein